jgi:hypothetical protein
VNFTSTPIFTGQQQTDAAISEAERGEVGSIGGTGGTPRMDTSQRNQSLMRFFRPEQQGGNSADQQPAPTSQDQQPSNLSKAVGAGKSALSIGTKLRNAFSTPSSGTPEATSFPGDSMASLFKGDFKGTSAPTSDPFAGVDSTTIGAGTSAPMSDPFAPETTTAPNGGTGAGGGLSVTPGTAAGVAGGLAGLVGGLTGNKDVSNAGTGLSLAAKGADIAKNGGQAAASLPQGASMLDQSMAAGGGAVGSAVNMGFGVMAGASNAAAAQYIGERMGPIAGQITNTIANLAQIAGPLGTAAGMFLSGIMGAIASGFSSPVYAEHRDQAVQSIQQLLPVIADALPHIHTEQDFQQLQNAVNALAQRWSLNSGGITGGYEAGGDVGAQFNPLFTQALPLLEQRGYQPGEQTFSDWFKNYGLQKMAGGYTYEPGD